MRIKIDPPAKRPLTPNEQRVYKLLCEGTEPFEIARRLHMGFRMNYGCAEDKNTHDSVMGLIMSIREKGWDIPENRPENKTEKEENTLPRGIRTSEEVIAKIKEMRAEGHALQAIAEDTGVELSTVSRILKKEKVEPAPQSSTDPKSNHTCIIPQVTELVNISAPKNANEALVAAVVGAVADKLDYLDDEINDLNIIIKQLEEQLDKEKRRLGKAEQEEYDLKRYLRATGYADVLSARELAEKVMRGEVTAV